MSEVNLQNLIPERCKYSLNIIDFQCFIKQMKECNEEYKGSPSCGKVRFYLMTFGVFFEEIV